ncbi:MAG: hypothetical protein QW279_10740, partial [Candidatus Jordarchaeaceae archaeon]
ERGKFYILGTLQNNRNVRLNALGYDIVQMFNGNNSLSEIEKELKRKGVTTDVYRFVIFLAKMGFIENLEVNKPKIWSIGTIKYPLINANSQLTNKLHSKYKLFSPPFLMFYVLFCGAALFLFVLNLSNIIQDAPSIFYPTTSIACLLVALVLFFTVEFLHELAHAATYYNIGGIPQTIGFCYHFLIPFFYTDVPGIHLFESKKSIKVFLAGPFSTIFFGSLFTVLHFTETTLRPAWAMLSYACFFSALFTLTPFVKTDGYYVLESLLKFPNFHTHALRNIYNSIKYVLGFLSHEEYKKYRSRYSKLERKILDAYCLVLPFGMFAMIYVSVFMILQIAIPSLFIGIHQLITIPKTATLKTYVILIILASFTVLISYGIFTSILRLTKRKKETEG